MAQYHGELFEILLDKGTMAAFTGGVDISRPRRSICETCWFEGPDPTIFPNGELPMKKVVLDDTMEIVADFPIAALFSRWRIVAETSKAYLLP